jgi:hypothetical protein
MPLEDVQAIDIGRKMGDGAAELVITDSGVTADPVQRLELLREKLRTYATYIKSREFNNDFPGVCRDRLQIRVVCANPPSDEMLKLHAISIKGDSTIIVPIVYDHFPSPSTPKSS